jgi:hypothetical protein
VAHLDPASLDLSALFGGFDPASLDWSALLGGLDPAAMSLDLGELFSGFDPTGISADFAALIEDLTSAWVPDLATSALSVFKTGRRCYYPLTVTLIALTVNGSGRLYDLLPFREI